MTAPAPDAVAPHSFQRAHSMRDIVAADDFPENPCCMTPRARAEN
jgi:hypothetical protein